MKALVTLTPEESKRLIAKAIVDLPVVAAAKRDGIIVLARCSSAGFVAEELIGRPLEKRTGYISGVIGSKGLCALQGEGQERILVLDHGEEVWLNRHTRNAMEFVEKMDEGDVIIKSGNVLDTWGNVGSLVASPDGGEIGHYLPYILGMGINLIIPMTLSKTIAYPVPRILSELGISRLDEQRTRGMLCGMVPMPGKTMTEIDAVSQLSGAEAIPVGMNGVGEGRGATVLLISGLDHELDSLLGLIEDIKKTPQPVFDERHLYSCDHCHSYLMDHPELGVRCGRVG